MMNVRARAAWGTAAGAVALIPMTAGFWVARAFNLVDEVPPHKATRSVFPRLSEPQLTVASTVAHVVVGATAGSVFTLISPARWFGVRSGMVAGMAVWLAGYEVLMPAVTDIAPAHRDRRDRAVSILVAHLIWGAALGLIAKQLTRRAVPSSRR